MVYDIHMEHEPRRDNEPSEGRFKVSESDVIEYAKKRYGIKMRIDTLTILLWKKSLNYAVMSWRNTYGLSRS